MLLHSISCEVVCYGLTLFPPLETRSNVAFTVAGVTSGFPLHPPRFDSFSLKNGHFFEGEMMLPTSNQIIIMRLMEEILHHLGWLKPYESWDNHHPWWWRILSINSISVDMLVYWRVSFHFSPPKIHHNGPNLGSSVSNLFSN